MRRELLIIVESNDLLKKWLSYEFCLCYAVVSLRLKIKKVYYLRKQLYNHCGDDSVEDPPVPIPNTEVKLNCAESTWLDTTWEDRELPHFIIPL